jgi:hypothetical protein
MFALERCFYDRPVCEVLRRWVVQPLRLAASLRFGAAHRGLKT